MKRYFNPSLMCMDFLDIRHQIEILNSRVDFYHFDMMDGHYVPNITLSPDLAKAVAKVSDLPLDCHLMVTDPQMFIEPCRKAVEPLTQRGIRSFYSPHAEVINGKAFRIIDEIVKAGFRPGVAINPETPLSERQRARVQVGRAMLLSALARRESRGAHWRSDFPETDEAQRSATIIKYDGGKYSVRLDEERAYES